MDLRKVKKLIELVEESGIAELEVSSSDESVRIAMNRTGAHALVAESVVTAPVVSEQAVAPATASFTIAAPMAGTFYAASSPQAEPYITQGQLVQAGDVVCIIESMKMMHEIKAAESGSVIEICVDNGQPINSGDVLFKLS